MFLRCHAVVPNKDERNKLMRRLQYNGIPFTRSGDQVTVNAYFLTERSAERVITLFYGVTATERKTQIMEKEGG